MATNVQFYGAIAYIVIFLAIGYYFKRNPPGKINWLYGYRTRRSMSNQNVWDAANRYWTHIFFHWQWFTFLFPLISFFIFPTYIFMITVLGHSALLIITMPATEIYLDKHFDKNGNPK